jgi:serine/threonine protein kinase
MHIYSVKVCPEVKGKSPEKKSGKKSPEKKSPEKKSEKKSSAASKSHKKKSSAFSRTTPEKLKSSRKTSPAKIAIITPIKKPHSSKIIGSGTYGCVYRPALQCSPPCEEERCTTGVSKLLSTKHAVKELDAFRHIDKLNPLYFIRAPILCNLPKNTDIDDCNSSEVIKAKSNNKSLSLLIYDDAGMNVYEYLKNHFKPEDISIFLNKFTAMFYAIEDLWKNRIIHDDIKLQNMVIDKDINIKLIDYGLMWHKDDGPVISYKSTNFVYAPDRKKLDEKDMNPNRRNIILSKLDTFSLGIALKDIIRYVKKALVDYEIIDFKNLANNMTNPNSYRRYSAIQALTEWNTILQRFGHKK